MNRALPFDLSVTAPSVEAFAPVRRGGIHALPRWMWIVTAILMVWAGFSANPVIAPFSILLLVLFPALLWRPDEPPVLVFACAMQWLQAASVIFYANTYGLSISEFFGGPQLQTATWLSLLGVAVNALGMKVGLLRLARATPPQAPSAAKRVNLPNAFLAYIACFIIATVAERFASAVPSVAQLIYAIATLKWVAIFVLFYSLLQQRSGYGFLALAITIEVGSGVLGYFSSFKSVFFVLLVASLTSAAVRRKQLLTTAAIAVVLLTTGIVWSAVKQDYREFLNQGTGEQQVLVSMEDRTAKLSELLGNVSWESFTNGLDSMVMRVSQVSLFAYTLMNVPDQVPHAGGALWADAVRRVFMPRVLFPDKTALDDSQRTNVYTGLSVAGVEQGTSMGIGYVAESYVDFGPVLMFLPIFLLGLFYGFIYRLFVRAREQLLGYGIAIAILTFGAYTIETSNAKLVGGNLTVLLVLGALYLFLGRPLTEWLQLAHSGER